MEVCGIEVRIGEPEAVGGLVLFPVVGEDVVDATVMAGSKALEEGLAEVEELEVPSVPELKVKNHGTVPVLFLEGELLLGAAQDRTLNVDVLCAAGAEVILPVSCVEAGRWGGKRRAVVSSPTHAGPTLRSRKVLSLDADSAPRSRRGDQSGVWQDVADFAGRHGVSSPTSALSEVNEAALADLESALANLVARPGQLGMVLTRGPQVLGAEIFGRASLLEGQLSRILRGYLVEAGSEPLEGACSAADVAGFLESVNEAQPLVRRGVSLGEELHLRTEEVVGTGLRLDGAVLHVAAFASMS